jgi:hypothetical protein
MDYLKNFIQNIDMAMKQKEKVHIIVMAHTPIQTERKEN